MNFIMRGASFYCFSYLSTYKLKTTKLEMKNERDNIVISCKTFTSREIEYVAICGKENCHCREGTDEIFRGCYGIKASRQYGQIVSEEESIWD